MRARMTAAQMSPLPLLLVVSAYLIGSVPFSFLIARRIGRQDIRHVGSGNVGATNVFRSAGRRAGAAALILDLIKGWGAVRIAAMFVHSPGWPWPLVGDALPESESFWLGMAALLAVLGHIFPVWLRFRGGKGIATAAGAFFAIQPLSVAFALLIFVGVVATTRYVSLGSMAAAASVPLILRFFTGAPFWSIFFTILIATIVILKHHTNIARLVNGTERRFPDREQK